MVKLHRFIIGKEADGWEIDHVDRNPLNNQLCNCKTDGTARGRRMPLA